MNSIGDLDGKTVFFLQGPMGSFFSRLDKQMRKQGAITYKIALNAGDWFFANKDNVIVYRDTPEKWGQFIHAFFKRHKVDYIFLFGDCRYYQRIAISIGKELGIQVFVFEEGYIRPDYITLERFGVNHFSKIPRNRAFYDQLHPLITSLPKPMHNSYSRMVISAILYYLLGNIFHFIFPHYKHHRGFSWFNEMIYGLRSAERKYYFRAKEKHFDTLFSTRLAKQYYFVPLQVQSDFQIREHSSFNNIKEFIQTVIISFALHAPKETQLIFKHHPMDRGRIDYTKYIFILAQLWGIENRVHSLHEIHLPTCLKNTIATVTINSTVGLSSLYHNIPTITLGKALYDIEGLTCKGMKLDEFWTKYRIPDPILFQKFRTFIIKNTQVNSSFYGDLGELSSEA